MKNKNKVRVSLFLLSMFIIPQLLLTLPVAIAQSTDSSNPNSSGFRLAICDGPAELNHINPKTGKIESGYINDPDFIPCNFEGAIRQITHLINIMIITGVFVAIIGFAYAGYLYITGVPDKITKAHGIFKKVGLGFIIMLSAWFIVYQILTWFTGNSGLKALLGNP